MSSGGGGKDGVRAWGCPCIPGSIRYAKRSAAVYIEFVARAYHSLGFSRWFGWWDVVCGWFCVVIDLATTLCHTGAKSLGEFAVTGHSGEGFADAREACVEEVLFFHQLPLTGQ